MRATDLVWFKSSYSKSGGHGNCVEVALARQKSRRGGGDGDDRPAVVHVRDSKVPDGARLGITARAWGGFLPYAAGRR